MKKFNTLFLSTLGLGLLASQAAQAQQSIGNGATPPRTGTMLDVNGPLATAETAVAATGTTAPTATIATATGQVQLTTGTATAGPITVSYSAATNPGQRLVIYNSTALAATFNSQDIPAGQAVEFVYSNSGWRASAGGGNSVAATNGLTKTGNTIGLGGTLTRPTTVDGVSATNPLSITGTTAATFANTTAPASPNVTNRVLALRGGYNGGVIPSIGGAHLSFLEGGNNEVGRVASVQENGPFNIGLGFHTANGTAGTVTERLRISAAGNVGIGTTAPNTRLSISPNATEAKITLYDGGSTTTHFGFGISNGQLNYDVPLGQNHVFFVNSKNGSGSEIFRLNANGASVTGNASVSGNVGIGTTAPSQALDVNGTARLRAIPGNGGTVMLTADNNGVIRQQALPVASAPAVFSTTSSGGADGIDITSASPGPNTMAYTGRTITIPANSTYIVNATMLLTTSNGPVTGAAWTYNQGSHFWVRSTLCNSPTAYAPSSFISGPIFISGSLDGPLGLLNGSLRINNTSNAPVTLYYWGGLTIDTGTSVSGSTPFTGTLYGFGASRWNENQLYGIPSN